MEGHEGVTFLLLIVVVFVIEVTTGLTCHQREYLIGQECCPLCLPGNRVDKHCTKFSSTSCVPCDSGTYMDVPSGWTECLRCRSCDSGSGLRVKVPCSSLSNAVCEPEEGHFCVELSDERSCKLSRKHSLCRPGEYVKTPGSSSADTMCSPCPSGSFSDGTLSVCRAHTRCEEDKVTVKEGTPQSDAECGERDSKALAIGISVGVLLVLLVGAAVLIFIIKRNMFRSTKPQSPPAKEEEEKKKTSDGTEQITTARPRRCHITRVTSAVHKKTSKVRLLTEEILFI